MKKSALLMTAATVALLSGPALADTTTACDTSNTTDYTSITSKITVPLCTDTADKGAAGDIEITATGSVVLTKNAGPIVTIDSDAVGTNSLITDVGSLMSANSTDSAVGIKIVTSDTAGTTPVTINGGSGIQLSGTLNLTGDGGTKQGLYLFGDGTYVGNIVMVAGSSLSVTGDNSNGIVTDAGSTLQGNLILNGTVAAGPASTSGGASSPIGVYLGGDVTGNVDIGSTGVVGAVGTGAEGVVVAGDIGGFFENENSISARGTATAKATGNPSPGSALIIAGSVGGGIENAGPTGVGTAVVTAAVSTTSSVPAFLIEPGAGAQAATAGISIGYFNDATFGASTYSFLNRGTINATPLDSNLSSIAFEVSGSGGYDVTFAGGIYNSGSVSATSTNTSVASASQTFATAFYIGGGVTVPGVFRNESVGTVSSGTISAVVSGPKGGIASALLIGLPDNSSASSLPELDNYGTISATALTSDLTLTGTSTSPALEAVAIRDNTGTLKKIDNVGAILAAATTLDNNSQLAIAADLHNNTTGVDFVNSGAVTGNILFGNGPDTLTVGDNTLNSSTALATVTGDITFNGGDDTMTINNYGTVRGTINKSSGDGSLSVTVATQGALYLQNATSGLVVSDLSDDGVLGITLSQDLIGAPVIKATGTAADTLKLGANATMPISVASFIGDFSAKGATTEFVLLQAPAGALTVDDPDAITTSITNDVPFLFTGTVCAYGIAGFATASGCTATPTSAQLALNLASKAPGVNGSGNPDASHVGLTGYAAAMFPYANAALATDDTLGASVINAGLPANNPFKGDEGQALTAAQGQQVYQDIYDQFAPDVTGASRAIAISLTDQSTGPVGARQRALRMYANQPAQATLWGQEFAERINEDGSTPGGQFRDSGFGFVLGMDGGSPRNGRYGAALTFYSGNVDEKAPRLSRSSTLWYMLTGYTDWRGKGFFLDSQLSVGLTSLSTRRTIRISLPSINSAIQRTAEGNRNGLYGAAGLTTGVILSAGSTVFTPQLSFDGLAMREDSYSETGANGTCGTSACDGFDLKVNPGYANSLRAFAGASLREDFNFGGWFLQPLIRGGYRYDFLNDPAKVKASFVSTAGSPGSEFSLTGPDPGRGNIVGGASVSVTTDAWSIGVNFDYLRSGHGSVTQAGTITLVGRI